MLGLYSKKKFDFLHGNLIESEPGRYVAFFDEFPEIIAQGNSEEDVKDRLLSGLISILKRRKNGI